MKKREVKNASMKRKTRGRKGNKVTACLASMLLSVCLVLSGCSDQGAPVSFSSGTEESIEVNAEESDAQENENSKDAEETDIENEDDKQEETGNTSEVNDCGQDADIATENGDMEDAESTPEENDVAEDAGNVAEDNGATDAEQPAEETEEPSAEPEVKYTITPCDGTKYAKSSVNVRNLPEKKGNKIGSLAMNQEVRILGQCVETGWYQISYQNQEAYVSNQYLVDEPVPVNPEPAPSEQPAPADPNVLPVPIKSLQNYKSLKKKCTDAEFQQAYDVALTIVTPLIGLSQEEQVYGIGNALANYYITYSDTEAHYNDPYGFLINNCASCAGCTRTMGLCLNMLGISYEHVNENQWCHQWARAYVNGTYWVCDCQIGYYAPEPAPYEHPFLWY